MAETDVSRFRPPLGRGRTTSRRPVRRSSRPNFRRSGPADRHRRTCGSSDCFLVVAIALANFWHVAAVSRSTFIII